jgi:DNA-binding response OmpR family regulator
MMKVLIADDEERMRRLVSDFLSREGYQVIEASDGKDAINKFFQISDINLIILDVMMPYLDGWEVLLEIRKTSQIPVIMLTAKSGEKDELHGFYIGADEYVSKPFSPLVLVARVKALLKRFSGNKNSVRNFKTLTIDEIARSVTVDNTPIELSPKEYELLLYFAMNEGIALSRDQILNAVWDMCYDGDGRTIDTHIKKLRVKLGVRGDCIKTLRGFGYRFEVDK